MEMESSLKKYINDLDNYTIIYKIIANICFQISINKPHFPSFETTKFLILTNMYELLLICDQETRNILMRGHPGSLWNKYMIEIVHKYKISNRVLKGGDPSSYIAKLMTFFSLIIIITQATILTTKAHVEHTVFQALINPGQISAFKNDNDICVGNARMGGIFATSESIDEAADYLKNEYEVSIRELFSKEYFSFKFGLKADNYIKFEQFHVDELTQKINKRMKSVEQQLGRNLENDECIIISIAWRIPGAGHALNIIAAKDGSVIISDPNGQHAENFMKPQYVNKKLTYGVSDIGLLHTRGFYLTTGEPYNTVEDAMNIYLDRSVSMHMNVWYLLDTVAEGKYHIPKLYIENNDTPIFISKLEDAIQITKQSHIVMNNIIQHYTKTYAELVPKLRLKFNIFERRISHITVDHFITYIFALFLIVGNYERNTLHTKTKKNRRKYLKIRPTKRNQTYL